MDFYIELQGGFNLFQKRHYKIGVPENDIFMHEKSLIAERILNLKEGSLKDQEDAGEKLHGINAILWNYILREYL